MPSELSRDSADKLKKAKSLLEALQIIAAEHQSYGVITVKQADKQGRFFFKSGRIQHASFPALAQIGEDALASFVSFKNPSFTYSVSETEAPGDQIDASPSKKNDANKLPNSLAMDLLISDFITQISPVAFEHVSDKRVPVKLLLYISLMGSL